MLSKQERRAIERTSYFGSVSMLWPYLELILERELKSEDKREIAVDYLGWKEEHAKQMFRE